MPGLTRREGAPDLLDQHGYDLRLEWGTDGLRRLAPVCPVIVIVDVLSFTTSVTVAVGRGATVLPDRARGGVDARADADADMRTDAVVAGPRVGGGGSPWTLSPASLTTIPPGTRLVLPSPNGSALAFGAAEAGARQVVAACIRNAGAVGRVLARVGGPIGLIPAGERWRGTTGPLRPALEDLLGAGAVATALCRDRPGVAISPEARAAMAAWGDAREDLIEVLAGCSSARELVSRGFADDVAIATEVDVDDVVPLLGPDGFRDRGGFGLTDTVSG